METVNLSLPANDYSESDQKYPNFLWRCYEKLSAIGEKYYIPTWMDKGDQDPDKWPFY